MLGLDPLQGRYVKSAFAGACLYSSSLNLVAFN